MASPAKIPEHESEILDAALADRLRTFKIDDPALVERYRRQRAALDEHYRTTGTDLLPIEEDDIEGWV